MIILLCGPTGSGKTDTSWALINSVTTLVFLDCDWFASLTPFSWQKSSDVQMVYQALSTMIDFYQNKGYINFVITLTTEMALVIESMEKHFLDTNNQIYRFRLQCAPVELNRRILQRDRIDLQKQQELKDSIIQEKLLSTAFPNSATFTIIEVTGKSELEVAHLILQKIDNLN